jgi:pyruvate kinase
MTDIVDQGDTVVIAAGLPLGIAGNTNLLEVRRVGEYL